MMSRLIVNSLEAFVLHYEHQEDIIDYQRLLQRIKDKELAKRFVRQMKTVLALHLARE